MDIEPAANLAEAPVDVEDTIIDWDAPTEAQAPAVEEDDDLAKLALGTEEVNPEEEFAEVEYEGEMVKVPVKVKDALLRQADYTRKTMEVAEERKAVQAIRQEAEQARNISLATIEASAQARQLDVQIEQLKNTSTQGLTQEQINGLRIDLQDMERSRATIMQDIQQLKSVEAQQESEEFAKLRQETLSIAAKEVPNFTDTRRTELETLAVKLGASPETVAGITEPFAYKVLHFADIGMKFAERQKKAAAMTTAQAGSPTTKISGQAGASVDLESASMEEYIAARKSGKI